MLTTKPRPKAATLVVIREPYTKAYHALIGALGAVDALSPCGRRNDENLWRGLAMAADDRAEFLSGVQDTVASDTSETKPLYTLGEVLYRGRHLVLAIRAVALSWAVESDEDLKQQAMNTVAFLTEELRQMLDDGAPLSWQEEDDQRPVQQ